MKRTLAALALVVSVPTGLMLAAAAAPPTDTPTVVHVLNRLSFGPRPGEIERVQQMGIQRYIDEQLHPERLPDLAMAARLAPFATLTLSSKEISERYEQPALQARREQRRQSANMPADGSPAARRPNEASGNVNLPLLELSQQKILRAAYSDRQLQEVLVDFWFNHFNVDARKGPTRYLLTEYERDAIRPHVMGKFRDLLGATAKSPAMLFYLDNWMSAAPDGARVDRASRSANRRGPLAPRGRRGVSREVAAEPRPRLLEQRPNMSRGLNENYARELLELHTLGVDGGYSQKDVTDVARAFTGWTIDGPRQGGSFRFAPALHDDRDKVILGRRLTSGGQGDGEEVLDLLAAHPSTATHIARKLAQRFVSDTPPNALIARVAGTFTRTGGDLRAVMSTLLGSPEFMSVESHRDKVKTPLEFVVSAVRALDAQVTNALPLVRAVQELGMPLYQCQPPTGYKDTADVWVNTGSLVNRMNLAQRMASGAIGGLAATGIPDPAALLNGALSDSTRSTIARASTPSQAVALALGSPEFQQR